MAETGDDLLSTNEAAVLLGVTGRQVRNLIAGGLLPATKLGRDLAIRRADLAKVPTDRRPGPKAKPSPVKKPATSKGKAPKKGKL